MSIELSRIKNSWSEVIKKNSFDTLFWVFVIRAPIMIILILLSSICIFIAERIEEVEDLFNDMLPGLRD